MDNKEIKPIELQPNWDGESLYINDESHLIASSIGYHLGLDGDHRLLTMNIDPSKITIFEAQTGNTRYPPGRMMGVNLEIAEFEAMIKIYQARLARIEELKAKIAASPEPAADDFDPFLKEEDDLP